MTAFVSPILIVFFWVPSELDPGSKQRPLFQALTIYLQKLFFVQLAESVHPELESVFLGVMSSNILIVGLEGREASKVLLLGGIATPVLG
jgi:hypothetical protein